MNTNPLQTDSTPPPERRLKDLVSPRISRDADSLRNVFLHKGIAALASETPNRLVLPPVTSLEEWTLNGIDVTIHRYAEVGIVVSGGMYVWWEGKTTLCPEGSLIVTHPGLRYQPHAELNGNRSQPHSVVWLALHTGCAVVHSCALVGDNHQLGEYHMFTEPRVTTIARTLSQELAEESPHYETVIRGSLLSLFSWLLRAPAQPIGRLGVQDAAGMETTAKGDEFSRRVEAYLLSHYHQPITLGQVARSAGCSEAYLCRRFRAATGQTPFDFLKRMRIESAKRLLTSNVPIGRVAEMVGYSDPLYFSKVFSAMTGMPPITFRAQALSHASSEPETPDGDLGQE